MPTISKMPKRARTSSQSKSQPLLNTVDKSDKEDIGHTPKWTRSSTSPSPARSISTARTISLEHSHQDEDQQRMQCILPGHPPMHLSSVAEFEMHYSREHNNQCLECKANLPSAWLLELHQSENHDPLVASLRDKGEKTYHCFLKDCEKITINPQKRRLHLIDKHGYPRDYDFRIVDSGSRGKTSLLKESKPRNQKRRISDVGLPGWRDRTVPVPVESSIQEVPMTMSLGKAVENTDLSTSGASQEARSSSRDISDETHPSQDAPVDSLSTAMSALAFVPMSVRLKIQKKP